MAIINRTNPNKNTMEENENQIIPAKTKATLFSNVIAPIKYKTNDVIGRNNKEKKLKYINPTPEFCLEVVRICRKSRNLL